MPATPVAPSDPAEAPAVEPEIDLSPQLSQQVSNYGLAQADSSAAPVVIGDFYYSGTHVGAAYLIDPLSGNVGAINAAIPLAGGANRIKVCENNGVLPIDRVFLSYNHFHNAIKTAVFTPDIGERVDQQNLDRYTLGVEKTFLDGLASFQIQMPISSRFANTAEGFSISGGDWGNLAMNFKFLVHQDDFIGFGGGLGLGLPTGSDGRGQTATTNFRLRNENVFIQPWAGVLLTPTDNLFIQGFVQCDFDATGNTFSVDGRQLARIQEQNFMYTDLSVGYWWFRGRRESLIEGLASMVELHYSTTINDTDIGFGGSTDSAYFLATPGNRIDILNCTAGLNFDLGLSYFRVAAVAPLKDEEEAPFDTELIVQWNRFF